MIPVAALSTRRAGASVGEILPQLAPPNQFFLDRKQPHTQGCSTASGQSDTCSPFHSTFASLSVVTVWVKTRYASQAQSAVATSPLAVESTYQSRPKTAEQEPLASANRVALVDRLGAFADGTAAAKSQCSQQAGHGHQVPFARAHRRTLQWRLGALEGTSASARCAHVSGRLPGSVNRHQANKAFVRRKALAAQASSAVPERRGLGDTSVLPPLRRRRAV